MSVRQDVSNIRSLWPDVPRHARQSAGHPTCSRRTSECLGRLFRLSRNDRTCDGLSMCQSASSIEFLAATEGAAGYRQDVSQRRRGRQDTGKMTSQIDLNVLVVCWWIEHHKSNMCVIIVIIGNHQKSKHKERRIIINTIALWHSSRSRNNTKHEIHASERANVKHRFFGLVLCVAKH